MRYISYAILSICLAACSSPVQGPNLDADAAQLAALTCAARQIRNERFQLADSIRFAEEALNQHPHLKNRIDSLYQLAESFTYQTKIWADSISNELARLHKTSYTTPESRKKLDTTVEYYLQLNCKPK